MPIDPMFTSSMITLFFSAIKGIPIINIFVEATLRILCGDTDSNSSLAVVFVENNEKQKWQQCYFYNDVVMALKGSAFSSAFHS